MVSFPGGRARVPSWFSGIWWCFAVLFFVGSAQAEPEIPQLTRRVQDQAGLLSPAAASRLESQLAAYEKETGHQFALLTVQSLDGGALEDFSIRVAEKWKLGDAKRDDGLLLLIAAQERQMRIEVGYGLEGAIPDALAARVIRHELTPAFRAGQFEQGIESAFGVLMKAASGEAVKVGPDKSEAQDQGSWLKLIPLLLLLLLVLSGRGGTLLPALLLSGMGGGSRGGGGGFGGFSGGGGFGGGGASGNW